MAKFDLQAYARRGAETRLAELIEELNSIYAAFPDLGRGTRGRRAGRPAGTEGGAATNAVESVPPRQRRRRMTAAQRKAVGERMRKYWAERRAASKK